MLYHKINAFGTVILGRCFVYEFLSAGKAGIKVVSTVKQGIDVSKSFLYRPNSTHRQVGGDSTGLWK